MYFPTPYPDEVLGSVISRACNHLGLTRKALIRVLLDSEDGQMSWVLPTQLPKIASVMRVEPEALLFGHTLFPFMTAFMPPRLADSLADKILRGHRSSESSVSSLIKSVTQPTKRLRYCAECAQDDLDRLGESYWRRAHLLPAVTQCALHGTSLIEVHGSNTSATARLFDQHVPEVELAHARPSPYASAGAASAIARTALPTLRESWIRRTDWLDRYRDESMAKGYRLRSGSLASSNLASHLCEYFSPESLTNLGCGYDSTSRRAWPALMVRSGTHVECSPLKHVLLQAFLAECSPDLKKIDHGPPGKLPRDPAMLDVEMSVYFEREWRLAKASGRRRQVTEILQTGGFWSTYRHDRQSFPKTSALVRAFRGSDEADRQLGLRRIWRLRHPARASASAREKES